MLSFYHLPGFGCPCWRGSKIFTFSLLNLFRYFFCFPKTRGERIKNCIKNLSEDRQHIVVSISKGLKIEDIKYKIYYGMNAANIFMLFISSLLSPGEAGLACVRPAFLFLEHVDPPITSRFYDEWIC
jgi:hypothetical protein